MPFRPRSWLNQDSRRFIVAVSRRSAVSLRFPGDAKARLGRSWAGFIKLLSFRFDSSELNEPSSVCERIEETPRSIRSAFKVSRRQNKLDGHSVSSTLSSPPIFDGQLRLLSSWLIPFVCLTTWPIFVSLPRNGSVCPRPRLSVSLLLT